MKLFESGKIGNMKLRNRIFMAPMGSATEDTDGGFSNTSIDYYAARAKGGCGMVMVSACVTKEFEGRLLYCLDSVAYGNRFARFTDEIHSYGTKVCVQLLAGFGRVGGVQPGTFLPTSASAVPYKWNPDITCRELTIDEIKRIVKAYGYAAGLAKANGADCVEIHGYGGYLIDQFMSSAWNIRTDEYGGNLENRMRFPMELMDAVRENCGKDFPILFKMTPCHYFPGGREMEEGIQIAKMLEEYGVDALHIDVGCYDSLHLVIPTVYMEKNLDLQAAEVIRKIVNIPVMTSGQLGNPKAAEQALQDGKIDYVGIGRGILADPNWANKIKYEKEEDIIPCIRCNEGCLGRVSAGQRIGCAVNPLSGKEKDNVIKPINEKKKILVIGAGPGGIEAALTASKQGHDVELWEKSDTIGGNLRAAGAPNFKKPIINLIDYYKIQCQKSNVRIVFNREATSEDIISYGADLVILGTGSNTIIPKIDGIDSENVVTATDVLLNKKTVGNKIVVAGGGLVGIETAIHLKQMGKDVTVVEMQDKILAEKMISNNLAALNQLMKENGLSYLTSTKVQSVNDSGIIVDHFGKIETIPCDNLVLAVGFRPNNSLMEELEGKINDIIIIGDAIKPRKILDSVWEGYYAIRALHESTIAMNL